MTDTPRPELDPALDPEVAAWLAAMAETNAAPETHDLEAGRAASSSWPVPDGPEVHSVADGVVSAPGRDIPVRTYRPADGDLPVVVFAHGGGWCMGTIDLVDPTCRQLALDVGAEVVSVGYRLAPEHPFPAGLDDVVEVTRRAAAGGRPTAIMGESAGGNLAAAAALVLAGEGVALARQVLVCPVLDHDLDRPSMLRAAEGYGLTRDAMRWFWDMYVPDPAQRDDPRASPVRAPLEALAAVAPATIVTAGFDPLADEGDEYARLLARAGVAVVHLPHPGAIHGFTSMPGTFSLAGPAIEAMAASLRASLHA